MEHLEKLEVKVREFLEKYKTLKKENAQLKVKAEEVANTKARLEESLLQETEAVSKLTDDRDVTKIALDELVSSLESLDSVE
ncbi:cell division protein ZapB [Candidatus Babeliales bacterium]|nr:cell division protein ZapB [Candidatus Babeliales bacterium]